MTEFLQKEFSRTAFLKGGGALVVGFSLAGAAGAGRASAATGVTAGSLPDPSQVDSWIRINPDNTVNLLTSQIDSVAESMQTTEKAISELQQITGLVDELEEPPALLERNSGKVTG